MKKLIFLLSVILIGIFLINIIHATDSTNTAKGIGTLCKNLYWFDENHNDCDYKQFCGAYMYYGLKTFKTLEECNQDLNKTSESCICTMIYKPVCGVDGKTYSNSCTAKCAKVEYTEGECKNETICKKEGETGHLNQKPNCCNGLTAITKSDKEESCDKKTGICRIETGGDYICTKCGDNVCGIGEDNYNCPKDCTNSGKSSSDQKCINGKCKDNKTDCEFDYDCPINNPNNFSCPVNNRVNCMPPILENNKDYCSGDYYLWIKKNCKVSFSY